MKLNNTTTGIDIGLDTGVADRILPALQLHMAGKPVRSEARCAHRSRYSEALDCGCFRGGGRLGWIHNGIPARYVATSNLKISDQTRARGCGTARIFMLETPLRRVKHFALSILGLVAALLG